MQGVKLTVLHKTKLGLVVCIIYDLDWPEIY